MNASQTSAGQTVVCERVRAPSCDQAAEQQDGDDDGPAKTAPSAPGDDVDEPAARVDQLDPGLDDDGHDRRRGARAEALDRRRRLRRRARRAAITQHRDQPGEDEREPADERARRARRRAGRCRSPSACSPGRAAGCRRRTRPRTRARRSSALLDGQIAQQRDVRGRPAEAEHADAAPLARHGGKGREGHGRILSAMGRLFDVPDEPPARPAAPPAADLPLAARMRPRTLEEFVGQTHLLGPSVGAADRDPVRRAALDDPLRAARDRQDDAGADARRVRRRGLRGALGGRGRARGGARGDGARPRAPPRRPPHDLLPGRDPPLQQGPAGRAAARGRGGAGRARRRDDREPVLRGQLGADLAHAGLRAARADAGGHRRAAAAGAGRGRARPSATR